MRESPLRKLHIETAQVSPYVAELSVSDTGPGISPGDKEKLFLPYFSTKERGTGLGLAIVSRILHEHHGKVRVENTKPAGARFVIELPTVAAQEIPASDGVEATLKV
jgi:signal transduction histidine kinase